MAEDAGLCRFNVDINFSSYHDRAKETFEMLARASLQRKTFVGAESDYNVNRMDGVSFGDVLRVHALAC